MSEELKPCPFCGSDEIRFDAKYILPGKLYSGSYACSNCESRGPDNDFWCDVVDEAQHEARTWWNTRHIPEGYARVLIEPKVNQKHRGMTVRCTDNQDCEGIYKAMVLESIKGDK